MTAQVQIVLENKYDDGSYSALARYYGFEYAIHFIANEIRVYGVNKNTPKGWKAKKNGSDLRKFFKLHIESFGRNFLNAHNALYEVKTSA